VSTEKPKPTGFKTMSNEEVVAFRRLHANDLCQCDHPRVEHYRADGGTGGCHQCRCGAYGLKREVVS